MNGAQKIKDRILLDAESAKKKILDDANREAQSITGNAEKEAFQRITVMTEKAKGEAIQIKQRFQAAEGMEDRKKILKARQDSIDEAFKSALVRLADLPDDQYKLFLESLILAVATEEAGIIVFNQKDKARLGDSFVSLMNGKLKAAGKNAVLSLSQDVLSSIGGFVIQYGDMEINCTLEVILNMARSSLESEVATILL